MKSDREKVRTILIETIVALCNKGLKYNVEMSVDGLIGITLDKRDVFLINIREVISTATGRKSGYGPGRPQGKKVGQIKRTAAVGRRKKMVGDHRIPNYLAVARDGGMATTNLALNDLNLEREKLDEPGSSLGLSAVSAAAAEADEDMDLPSEGEESDLRDIMMLAMKRQNNKPQIDPLTGEVLSQPEEPVPEQVPYGDETGEEEPEGKQNLPLPQSDSMEAPTEMVEFVNEIVAAGYHHRRGKKKKRGHYNIYSPDQRARIGQYAQEHGIMPAVRKFRNEFDRPLQDSSVRSMRKAYMDARKHLPDEDVEVTELPTKDRGRPLMLGEYDSEVVEYVEALKRNGVAINHQIVMDAARGVLLHHDKNKLKEFGGPLSITRKWAESFIRRIRKWNEDEPDIKKQKLEDDEMVQPQQTVITDEELQAQVQAQVITQAQLQQQLTDSAGNAVQVSGASVAPGTIHIQHPEGTIFSMAPMQSYQQQTIESIPTQLVQTQGLQTLQQTQQAQPQQQPNQQQHIPVQHITPLQTHMIAATPQMTHITQLSQQQQQQQAAQQQQQAAQQQLQS